MPFQDLTPEQALSRYESGDAVILDVRTHPEWTSGHIPGARHIPLHELPDRVHELDPEHEVLVICAHGIRSQHASEWLAVQHDFEKIYNVRYGMCAWTGPVEVGN